MGLMNMILSRKRRKKRVERKLQKAVEKSNDEMFILKAEKEMAKINLDMAKAADEVRKVKEKTRKLKKQEKKNMGVIHFDPARAVKVYQVLKTFQKKSKKLGEEMEKANKK